jgi:hypothetical protein
MFYLIDFDFNWFDRRNIGVGEAGPFVAAKGNGDNGIG